MILKIRMRENIGTSLKLKNKEMQIIQCIL